MDRAALGIVMLSSGVRRELASHARVYADGLLKFEPAELGSVRIPVVQARRDALAVFRNATALFLAGKDTEAEALADAWVVGCQGKKSKWKAIWTSSTSSNSEGLPMRTT